jgi:hypothetical protein
MNWSMPRPVLQVVAGLMGAVWLGAFAFAAVTAQERGRLPGQRLDGVTGQPIQAQEATPLTDERIQGAAPATELSDEEKAKLDEAKEAKEEAAAAAKAEAAGVQPVAPTAAPAQPAAPADAAPAAQPPAQPKPDEPPF